jgi:hypothetical protein
MVFLDAPLFFKGIVTNVTTALGAYLIRHFPSSFVDFSFSILETTLPAVNVQ